MCTPRASGSWAGRCATGSSTPTLYGLCSARDALLAEDGAGPFGPEGRPMGGSVTLPAAWHTTLAQAPAWIAKSLDHVDGLRAKTKSSTKKTKA